MTEQVCPSHINAAFDVGAHAPRGEIAGGGRMAAAWYGPYVRWARCQRWRAMVGGPSRIDAAFDVGEHAPRGEIAGGGRMAAAWSRPYVRWARCQRWRATMISYPQPWHDRRALASNRPALRVGYPLGAVAPGRRKVRRGTLWVWHPNQSERFPGASRAQRQKE